MKKLNIVKVLFAAASLALALPGCSDLGEESTAQTQVTKDGKVEVSLSVSENYRTIVSSVDTSELAYKLVIADTDDSTAEGYEEPKTVELSSLTGTKVYLTADKTYSFALTGYTKDTDGNATETAIVATRTAVTKKITKDDATVSLTLQAVTTATVNVTLDVSYDTGYGVSNVTATVYNDSALATAATDTLTLNSENEKNSDKTDGEVEFTGTIATGSTKWVRIALSDGTKEIGGKTIALYGIPTGDLSGEVDASIKEYKATVNLTADTKPASLILKNKDFEDNASYTGISLTTTSTDKPYVFTGYVPMGEYNVYNETTNIGQVSNTSALSVDTSVSLKGVAVAWKAEDTTTDTQNVTLYAASSADDTTLESKLKDALVVTATMSNGTQPVSSYTITDFDPTKTDAQNVTISYTYNGVTKTAIISVKLTAVVLESIEVASTESAAETDIEGSARTPLKVTYDTNDTTLDLTGMVLKLTNNDGSTSLVEYNGSNITESGYYADNNGVVGDSIAEVTTIFANIGTYWVEVTYSEKTTMYKVMVEKGVTYVVEGKYNVSTKANDGYYYDTTDGGVWTKKGVTLTKPEEHNGLYVTCKVEGAGIVLKTPVSDNGAVVFHLKETLCLIFTEINKKGVVITPSNGGSVNNGAVDTVSETLGADGKETTVLLTAGTYEMAGATNSSTSILTLEFISPATKWENAKSSAGTEDDYWDGWTAINTVLSATPSTTAEYFAAISALQEAIDKAKKYVKPTGITVKNGDNIVADGSSVSFSKASGNTLTLTAKENEGSTGSLTWTIDGIEGISKEVTVAEDGISTCVISGITEIGTINVTVADTDSRAENLSVEFTVSVIAQEVKVSASDEVNVVVSGAAKTVGIGTSLTATVVLANSYTENVSYKWYKVVNGVETFLEGETSAAMTYTTLASDAGAVSFKAGVVGEDATAYGSSSSVSVTFHVASGTIWKLGDYASAIGVEEGNTIAADTYVLGGVKFYTKNSGKTTFEKTSATIDGIEFTHDLNTGGTGSASDRTFTFYIDGAATVSIYCGSGSSSEDRNIVLTGPDKYSKTLTASKDKSSGEKLDFAIESAGTYVMYAAKSCRVWGIGVSEAIPDPNTTIDVSSGIYSDITLTQDESNANTFTVAGAPVTASGSTIAWLVDGVAVENESATTFTLTGKTTGEWYDVTVKVTTANDVVYTKTASVLYIGN